MGFAVPRKTAGQTPAMKEVLSPLTVHFMRFASESRGQDRAVFLIQVDNDKMRFLKRGDVFVAQYEFSLELFDRSDTVVERKYWDQEFTVDSFDKTLAASYQYLEPLEFDVKPGFYRYVVEMTDYDSKKTYTREGSKIFPGYWAHSLGFSDPYFTFGTGNSSDIREMFSDSHVLEVDYEKGFSINMQLFSSNLEPMNLTWELINFFDFEDVYKNESVDIEPGSHIIQFSIPVTGYALPMGTYLLHGVLRDQDGRKDEIMLRVRINWSNRPVSSYDIQTSLLQMKYILPPSVVERLDEMTPVQKKALFESFWKNRDPTPGTDKNEMRDEYFNRVKYANEHFSLPKVPGWSTERGEIYCIYGKPDERSFGINQYRVPVEFWIYSKIRKQFTFADYDGNGNYVKIDEKTIIR